MHLTVVLLVSLVLPCSSITATSSTSRSCLACTSCRQPSPRWCGTVWYFCAKACTRAVLCALPSPFQTTTPMGTARWVTCHCLCLVSHLSFPVPGESPVCAWGVTCLCLCLVSHLSLSGESLSLSVSGGSPVFVSAQWLWVTFVFAFHCPGTAESANEVSFRVFLSLVFCWDTLSRTLHRFVYSMQVSNGVTWYNQ